MGHEHDADAPGREAPQDPEQDRHLVGVEARGRLVEDQHSDALRHGPGDRHELLIVGR
jgi:hypothetical protein